MDAIQRRAIRRIGDPTLTDTLDSLAHRRSVSALSLFYRCFCSDEIKSILPPKASFARNTRFSKSQHLYALKLDTNRTNAFANSFIPMTSRNWNSSSYRLPNNLTFNPSRPASTDTFDPYPILISLLIFTIQGSTADKTDCTFLVQLLLV